MKHKDRRDPKSWKGLKFGVPFEFSMHNYLLRYYLAENGVDPDRDLQIAAVPPPQMVAKMKAGELDGFLAPDPMSQRAVYDGIGFIHLLSKEMGRGTHAAPTPLPRSLLPRGPTRRKLCLKPSLRRRLTQTIRPTAN